MTTYAIEKTDKKVGIGQIVVGEADSLLTTVLGSCVGVVIYDAKRQIASMAHVMLANSQGRADSPGRFADTAVPAMLEMLRAVGGVSTKYRAKLAGGASMFAGRGPMNIGENNVEAVRRALAGQEIPIDGEHLGGEKGRRVEFACDTGEYRISVAGKDVASI
jgi:chemotaxis protein CheD